MKIVKYITPESSRHPAEHIAEVGEARISLHKR